MNRMIKHHRHSIRLKDYDYSQEGAYFVTICTQNRECLFGEIVDGRTRLNSFGETVQACWEDLPNHYPNIETDAFTIMPNHIHGIIVIVGAGFKPVPNNACEITTIPRAGFKPAPTQKKHGLPEITRAFKTFASRRINELRNASGSPIWQRNYYEHVIRDEADLNRVRQYIKDNPARWADDEENPYKGGASV